MMKLYGKIEKKRLYGVVRVIAGRPTGDLQAKTVTPSAVQQIVEPDSGYNALSRVTVKAVSLQDKTVAPSTSVQEIKADTPYVGLNNVTVGAAALQAKEIAPTTEAQEVTPDDGYYGLNKVTVGGTPLQQKNVTPDTEAQEVTPDDDYYGLEKVTVGAVQLAELTVTPNSEVQTFTPESPCIGFSSVTVEAAPDTGGGDSGETEEPVPEIEDTGLTVYTITSGTASPGTRFVAPKIPDDILENYPYSILLISATSSETYTVRLFTSVSQLTTDGSYYYKIGGEYSPYYQWSSFSGDTEWVEKNTAASSLQISGYALLWSAYDILQKSNTSIVTYAASTIEPIDFMKVTIPTT